MESIMALGAAAVLGASDFIGGLVARRSSIISVMIATRVTGALVFTGVIMSGATASAPRLEDLAWGAAAGLAGSSGMALLYQGLAEGTMGAVAPVTAVTAAGVPVIAGFFLGERPLGQAMVGIWLGLIAIALIGLQPRTEMSLPSRAPRFGLHGQLGRALTAGVCIGAFYLLISNTSHEAGPSPLVAARCTGLGLFLVAGFISRQKLVPERGDRVGILAASVLDAAGTLLLLLALHRGLLSLMSLLTSFYPVVTVGLAVLICKERLTPPRIGGILLAGIAGGLIVTA